jgi:hypothetical protein
VTELDQTAQDTWVARGKYPVTKIEDMPVASTFGEDLGGLDPRWFPPREDCRRIEVSLEADIGTDSRSRLREGYSPVDSNDVRTGLGHKTQQLPCAHPEMDPWHIQISEPVQYFCR